MKRWWNRNQVKISRVLHVAVSLASIRCIIEILRLQYSGAQITAGEMALYLNGALLAGTAVLFMIISSFYSKYNLNIAVSVATIVMLVLMKSYCLG